MEHGRARKLCAGVGDERGFTLIELMVVVLIIGVLIGIALPVFLGARERAQNRAATTNLRSGLAAGLTYFAETSDWDGFDAAEAALAEANLDWIDGGDPAVGEISIEIHADWDLLMVVESGSGRFFCVAQVRTSPATLHGNGPTFVSVDTIPECAGGW
jgi:type IV pilus assembly protein PilA